LILLRFQNLWNLINVFKQIFNENVHLSVFYDFQSLMGPKKSRRDIFISTTQGQDCPFAIFVASNNVFRILFKHGKEILE
jgi:hypothetical protein